MDARVLSERAAGLGLNGTPFDTVESAYLAAKSAAGADDMIFTGGSTFVVADLLLMKF
jgi:dihydrofolate synthase/folylpolyglutamate synthase